MSGISAPRRAELEAAAEITEAQLVEAIEALPDEIREQLGKGPIRYSRYACRICDAFRSCRLAKDLPHDDPRWIVFNYHEVPKLKMLSAEDQWRGPQAQQVYNRCMTIYRAAGWEATVNA